MLCKRMPDSGLERRSWTRALRWLHQVFREERDSKCLLQGLAVLTRRGCFVLSSPPSLSLSSSSSMLVVGSPPRAGVIWLGSVWRCLAVASAGAGLAYSDKNILLATVSKSFIFWVSRLQMSSQILVVCKAAATGWRPDQLQESSSGINSVVKSSPKHGSGWKQQRVLPSRNPDGSDKRIQGKGQPVFQIHRFEVFQKGGKENDKFVQKIWNNSRYHNSKLQNFFSFTTHCWKVYLRKFLGKTWKNFKILHWKTKKKNIFLKIWKNLSPLIILV